MKPLISISELIKNNLTIFICLCAAVFVLLVVVFALIVHKIRKNKREENPEEYLIRQTLEEEKKNQKEVSTKDNKKVEQKKVEPALKEQVQPEEQKVEEPKEEKQPEVKEEKKAEPKTTSKQPVKKPQPKAEPKKEEKKVEETKQVKAKEEPKAEEKKAESKQPAKKTQPKAEPKKEVKEEKQEAPKVSEKKEEAQEDGKKKRTVQGKYELYFDGEKYYFVLKASNGEKLIKSELYASKDNALNAIEVIKRTVEDGNVIVTKDKRGLYQFTLLAKNHRKLVMSANYATEKGAISASESFKRFAGISPINEIKEVVERNREEITIDVPNKKGGKIGVVADKDNNFVYIVKASNGVILLNSDHYRSYDLALNGLNTFKEAYKTGKFFVEKDKRDYYQFKLYSQSGRLIVAGESYPTKQNAISACLSLCSFVEEAQPLD